MMLRTFFIAATICHTGFSMNSTQRLSEEHDRAAQDEESDEGLCVVCLDSKATHCLKPCGHKCLCDGKGKMQCHNWFKEEGTCPLCRAEVKQIIKGDNGDAPKTKGPDYDNNWELYAEMIDAHGDTIAQYEEGKVVAKIELTLAPKEQGEDKTSFYDTLVKLADDPTDVDPHDNFKMMRIMPKGTTSYTERVEGQHLTYNEYVPEKEGVWFGLFVPKAADFHQFKGKANGGQILLSSPQISKEENGAEDDVDIYARNGIPRSIRDNVEAALFTFNNGYRPAIRVQTKYHRGIEALNELEGILNGILDGAPGPLRKLRETCECQHDHVGIPGMQHCTLIGIDLCYPVEIKELVEEILLKVDQEVNSDLTTGV